MWNASQQDLILCVDDYDADPFDESVPELRLLQSSVIASPEVLKDLRIAFEEGEKQSNDTLEKWVFYEELSLITKHKRLNLATTPSNVTKTCSSAVQMERNFPARVIDLAKKNDVIAPELELVKRIFKERLTIFNVDGFMIKTAKSKLLQSF